MQLIKEKKVLGLYLVELRLPVTCFDKQLLLSIDYGPFNQSINVQIFQSSSLVLFDGRSIPTRYKFGA